MLNFAASERCEGWTGADFKALVTSAEILRVRRLSSSEPQKRLRLEGNTTSAVGTHESCLSRADLDGALGELRPSLPLQVGDICALLFLRPQAHKITRLLPICRRGGDSRRFILNLQVTKRARPQTQGLMRQCALCGKGVYFVNAHDFIDHKHVLSDTAWTQNKI